MLETSGLTGMSSSYFTCLSVWPWHGRDSGAGYHGDMPNRCQEVKPDSVSREENLAAGMRACQGIRPNTATEQRDACYRRAKTGNETHISFPSLQFCSSLSLSLCISLCLSLPYAHLSFMPPSHILYLSVHSFPLTPLRTSLIFDSLTFTPIHKQTKWRGRIHVSEWMRVFTVIAKSKWSPPPRRRLFSPRHFYSTLGWCRLGIISKQAFKEANCFIILKPRLTNLYVCVWCTDMLKL